MKKIYQWLLDSDPSLQYLAEKNLKISGLKENELDMLQRNIENSGYGRLYLNTRNPDGHWGSYYYQPKWTSTHYALLDMKNLGMPQSQLACKEIVFRMFDECMYDDGGINLAKSKIPSDICVDGMILNYASYFCPEEKRLTRLVDLHTRFSAM